MSEHIMTHQCQCLVAEVVWIIPTTRGLSFVGMNRPSATIPPRAASDNQR